MKRQGFLGRGSEPAEGRPPMEVNGYKIPLTSPPLRVWSADKSWWKTVFGTL